MKGRAACAVLALCLACTAPPWDPELLEARHPALRAVDAHRLGDASPYLLPSQGVLTAFLCRWPLDAAIPVSLPPDASAEEQRVLEKVLRAWERAGLGVRFSREAVHGVGIEVRFVDPASADPAAPKTATTIADCLVGREALDGGRPEVLPARLAFASVHLRRANLDMIDREVPLSEAELAGTALHELGHALGFQGHVRRGGSVMVRTVEQVRRWGRRILAGEGFRDANLSALYSVPSGSVVRRRIVGRSDSAPVDRLAEIARQRAFFGPFVRVGDSAGRIGWRDREGGSIGVVFYRPRSVLRGRAPIVLHVDLRAAELLESS